MAVLWLVLTLALIPGFYFIRMASREVSQYQVATFEACAREALAAGEYSRVLEICTGALKSGVNRDDHHGKVFSLRAHAYGEMGDWASALTELEACTAFWTRHYYYASGPDRAEAAAFAAKLGQQLLDAGNPADALRAFSAGGLVSGRPANYLAELAGTLSPNQRATFWPDTPYLIVQDFRREENALVKIIDEQGREVRGSGIDPDVSPSGGASARLELGESVQPGRCWYGIDVYIPISETPFALRTLVKEDHPSGTRLILAYWFESARKAANTFDLPAQTTPDNWERFDIQRLFYEERLAEANEAGYSIAGGIINKIALDVAPGPANRFWVDRIELYLP